MSCCLRLSYYKLLVPIYLSSVSFNFNKPCDFEATRMTVATRELLLISDNPHHWHCPLDLIKGGGLLTPLFCEAFSLKPSCSNVLDIRIVIKLQIVYSTGQKSARYEPQALHYVLLVGE